jgi:hypothetical protein
MKKLSLPIALLCLSFVVAGLVYAGEREAVQKSTISKAVIVSVGDVAHANDGSGVNKCESLAIHDEKLLAKLETFFPRYQTKPKSDIAYASEGKYEIYIELSDQSVYRIMLDFSGHWSSGGGGSLDTKGNASAFIEELYGKFDNPQ